MRLRQSFGPAAITFVIGVPAVWAVLLLFHPVGDSLYEAASSNTTAWLVVHLGTMVLIPALAATLFVVLRGFPGTAASVANVALVVFVIFYSAFEILVGVGVGLLVDTSAPEDVVTAFGDTGVIAAFETIGSLAWLVAVAAAGVAMYRRAHTASSVAVVLLFVISAPGVVFHVPPFGQVGLALFVVAVLLALREREPAREEEPLVAA
jgi:hypothetical protein